MKKILVLLLALSVQTTVFAAHHVDRQLKEVKRVQKYNSVKKLTRDHKATTQLPNLAPKDLQIKDPGLIKLKEYEKISESDYNAKLSKDETDYKKKIIPVLKKGINTTVNVDPAPVDFYKVYRISERLIRANKLDYANWRIAIKKTTEDFNAYSSSTNLIVIHTALYDTFYNDDDALAFVIAHEMSHHVLGHNERLMEIQHKLAKMDNISKSATEDFTKTFDSMYKLGYQIKISNELKMSEYMADAEAVNMLIRAGYSVEKAMTVFNAMDTISLDTRFIIADHPAVEDRIESVKENILFVNPNWVDEGKYNIYKSNILPCKKSSDRVSIVISKSENSAGFYQPENMVDKLSRLAYISYKSGKMEDAAKYFHKLSEIVDSYAVYLYESYANEYLYNVTKDKKYLKRAKQAAILASSIKSDNKYVEEQLEELNKNSSL